MSWENAMGMIFPWRLARQGNVPSETDFEEVAHDILELADQERVFKGVAFVGSLVRGDLQWGSDLDLILVARPSKFARAQALERQFGRLATERAVPLSSWLWNANDAACGRHMYGPSYLQTFPRKLGRFAIGKPLADCFQVPYGSVQEEMLQKLVSNLRSTQARGGIFMSRHFGCDHNLEAWLQRNWEANFRPLRRHIVIGRWLLWWLHGVLPDDGKAEVISRFLAEPEFSSLHGDYKELLDLDYRYDELLGRVVVGRERRGSYLRKVGNLLMENFQVSLRLLQNALSLTRRATTKAA
ncbi:MAG: hypothetical protein AAB413_03910 [Patescibacteria group bacterium]